MRSLLLVLALSLVGCATREHAPPPSYPGTLPPPAEIAWNFLARQRIAADHRDREGRFEAVLQKKGDELLLLALTPYGSRAFLIRQRGEEITLERFVRRELPFPPRFILLDIHRAFFRGLPGAPRADGVHRGTFDGDVIEERWRGGRLFERSYRRQDARPEGVIVVRYEDGMRPGESMPRTVTFDNGWFGYRLEIVTTEFRPLP